MRVMIIFSGIFLLLFTIVYADFYEIGKDEPIWIGNSEIDLRRWETLSRLMPDSYELAYDDGSWEYYGAPDGWGTTQIASFAMPEGGQFTICMGKFAGFGSPTILVIYNDVPAEGLPPYQGEDGYDYETSFTWNDAGWPITDWTYVNVSYDYVYDAGECFAIGYKNSGGIGLSDEYATGTYSWRDGEWEPDWDPWNYCGCTRCIVSDYNAVENISLGSVKALYK